MELKNMLSGLENLKVKGSLDIDISKIKNDSKEVSENDVFVALTGFNFDGHEYIEEAVKNGAKAVVMQEDNWNKRKNNNNIYDKRYSGKTRNKNWIDRNSCIIYWK